MSALPATALNDDISALPDDASALNARLEAMVVDAIIRSDADESVVSRASTLGWVSPTPGVCAPIPTLSSVCATNTISAPR